MKTKGLLSIVIGCVAAMFMTSCLGDDSSSSNQGLSKAEIAQCFALVKGNYTGEMIFYSQEEGAAASATDTLAVRWSIPDDSTAIIRDFPVSLLAANISNDGLKEAISALSATDLRCVIGFIETSPVEFLINPYVLSYQLEYGEATHKVDIVFLMNNIYSYGAYNATSGALEMKIVEAYIYIDDKQSSYLTTTNPFLFISKTRES